MAAATPRRTKIIATIGPASASPERLAELTRAGMDGARLNLSHGTHDEHRERARLVRATEAELGRPIALIADLQGPKLRIGELDGPVTLTRGEEIVVAGGERFDDGELPVSPAVIGEVLQPGHEVLIDDGLVRLRVDEIELGRARCAVLSGGVVSSHKGVNLPGVPIPIPSLTRKDMDDLELALEIGVDFVALSFVRSAADVRDLRALIEQAGSHAHVIAKIEKAEAVDALEDILAESDAVMVARGDLGVEIGPALVPLLQKRIITAALERGKPVITATQMLESMVHQAEPTRAEASDIANAILDGSSALMLSGETAVGDFPVESVTYMDRIARAVELRASIRVRRARTSEAERTNERATKSTPSSIANSRSSRSLRVIDGIGSGTPGRLTPLCEETTPPTITSQRARPRSTASTRSLTWPSSISTSLPICRTEPRTSGLIGRSPSCFESSPAITSVAPRTSVIGASRSPTRSFGPWRSAIRAIGRPAAASASRTRAACIR